MVSGGRIPHQVSLWCSRVKKEDDLERLVTQENNLERLVTQEDNLERLVIQNPWQDCSLLPVVSSLVCSMKARREGPQSPFPITRQAEHRGPIWEEVWCLQFSGPWRSAGCGSPACPGQPVQQVAGAPSVSHTCFIWKSNLPQSVCVLETQRLRTWSSMSRKTNLWALGVGREREMPRKCTQIYDAWVCLHQS